MDHQPPRGDSVILPTYKEVAYQMIKEAILYRKIKVGEFYSQDALCSELGINRTPVREALLELQKEGYISFMRGKGIQIVTLSRKQAEDILEMRYVIELAGIELAARRRTPAALAGIRASLEEMELNIGNNADKTSLYKLDRKFHVRLFEAAGNNMMLDALEDLRDQFLRMESQSTFDNPAQSRQVVEEHRRIYSAVEEGDADTAREAMRSHLDLTYRRTVKPIIDTLQNYIERSHTRES
ncbi:MAG: GntR family transcriptional regulator [Defluviitaleaceae bacterium]|nr:GntR family transcriptional regulator [Defluviitaleaceae bacterium]